MALQSVLVTDTNIWIDLENGGMLAEVFLLPRKFLIPDFAIRELIRPRCCQRQLDLPINDN
jgi:hypothetical protein